MLELIAPHRGADQFGSGAYHAPRGRRKHNGLDYAAAVGSVLRSPVEGRVSKLGIVYQQTTEFRYVEITDYNGLRHRYFYLLPIVSLDQQVRTGDPIGRVQDISSYHEALSDDGRRMTNHLHMEIKQPNGEFIDPGALI